MTVYDRVRVEPTDESFLDAIAFASAGQLRRVRRGRRRLDDRHGQGRQPLHDLSARRLSRLREPADRQGPAGSGSAQAADRDPDDRRHRQRDHRRQHLRSHAAARQDRHRQSTPQADARTARSGEHADDAAGGRGLERPRHPEPRRSNRSPRCRTPAGRSPDRPALRPAYQGSNPISDVWSLQALRMVAQFLVRAVADPSDDEARAQMLLAASYAGRRLRQRRRALAARHVVSGLRPREVVSAPGTPCRSSARAARHLGDSECARRSSASPRRANPERHLQAAEALGADVANARDADAGRILADRITWFMRELEGAERPARDRLLVVRYPRARRGHAAAASRDEALAARRRVRRSCARCSKRR